MNLLHIAFEIASIAAAFWLFYFSVVVCLFGERKKLVWPPIVDVMLISSNLFLVLTFLHVIFDWMGLNVLGASGLFASSFYIAPHLSAIVVFSLAYLEYQHLLRNNGVFDW